MFTLLKAGCAVTGITLENESPLKLHSNSTKKPLNMLNSTLRWNHSFFLSMKIPQIESLDKLMTKSIRSLFNQLIVVFISFKVFSLFFLSLSVRRVYEYDDGDRQTQIIGTNI